MICCPIAEIYTTNNFTILFHFVPKDQVKLFEFHFSLDIFIIVIFSTNEEWTRDDGMVNDKRATKDREIEFRNISI